MATASAELAILFIASLIVAASVGGIAIEQGQVISQSISANGDANERQIRTEITIVTDSSGPIYNVDGNENITIHVKNSGARPLPTAPDQIDVFLDNAYQSDITVTPLDGSTWPQHGSVRIEFSSPTLSAGTHRVKVVIAGDSDVLIFRT